jgi:hypothetical protein
MEKPTSHTAAVIQALSENGDPVSVDAAEHMEALQEALDRLSIWGGLDGKNYSYTIAADVLAWVKAGMFGDLPPLPEWANTDAQGR